jgi:hypothetical protein
MTLGSRRFTASDSLREVLDYAESVFAGALAESGLELEIALRPRADRRAKKERLARAVPGGAGKWAKHGYEFDFGRKRYRWNGVSMHVTAGEALFLFRWLMEGSYSAAEKYYLHNLRKRYGTEFLAEEAGR